MKHMNQMQLYAKCVTIRDAQIEEKKHMMLEEEEENRRLDLMMEIERYEPLCIRSLVDLPLATLQPQYHTATTHRGGAHLNELRHRPFFMEEYNSVCL